jgi:hypothetical protein
VCGELEHQTHIITCTGCPLRTDRRSMYQREMRRFLADTHTHPDTSRIILRSIQSFLSSEEPPELEEMVPNASPGLQHAYAAQLEIGWGEWFKGRISKHWKLLYDQDLQTTNHNMYHQTSIKWAATLIGITWRFVLDSWSMRNNREHGVDTNPLEVRKKKLIRKILWQKDHIDHFPNRHLATLSEE